MSFKHIPFGSPEGFNAIVEIPRGSSNKYELDEELDAIKLDWVFPESFKLPFDYGCIPQTRGGDGDALDVYILNQHPLTIGTIVLCRPIGIIKTLDRGEVDDKIFAIPIANHHYEKYQDIADLDFDYNNLFVNFFKELGVQKNKKIEGKGFFGRQEALAELKKSHAHFLAGK